MKRINLKIASTFAIIASAISILGSVPAKYAETPRANSNKIHEGFSAAQSAQEIAKECDIFNQSDADILAQLPGDKECYFAGCGGFF